MKLMPAYAAFYAEGREEKTLKNDIDTDAIAERVINGDGSPYELCLEAATAHAASLQNDRKRRAWFEENAGEITAAGGDKDEAYRHYCAGRIDELAGDLEGDVVEAMSAELLGDEDDDDDDENEDDGEES